MISKISFLFGELILGNRELTYSTNMDPNTRPTADEIIEHPFLSYQCGEDEIISLVQTTVEVTTQRKNNLIGEYVSIQ